MSEAAGKQSALVVATVSSFLAPFLSASINVALPTIGSHFRISAAVLGWIPTSYLLAASVLLVPFGRMADIAGRRRVFLYGISFYTLSSLLAAAAPSVLVLIAARVLQGISVAMMFGIGIAILTSVFPPQERGRALGINAASVYVGLSLGPFLGGVLTQHLGWRSVFGANVLLGAFALILVLTRLRTEWAEARGARFDCKGSLLYSLSLLAVMYGFSVLPGRTGAGLVAAGIAGLIVFVRTQLRSSSPVLDMNLFRRNRVFAFSSLATFLNYSAAFGTNFLMSLYLQYIRALSPRDAGLLLLVQPVVMAAGSPFAGRLSDRIRAGVVASAGMGVIAGGLLFFAFLGEATPLSAIGIGLASLGLGFALFSSPNTNAAMGAVDRSVYGVAAGILATTRMNGQTMSLGIATMLLGLFVGGAQITPEVHPQFIRAVNTAFGFFSALCLVGVFASLVRNRP